MLQFSRFFLVLVYFATFVWFGSVFVSSSLAVDVIDFEAPLYTASDVTDPKNVTPSLNGQEGWDSTGGASENAVLVVPDSGAYVGGQAAGHVDDGGGAFLGKLGFSPVYNGNMMQADFFGGDSAFGLFDGDGVGDSVQKIGGWVDANEDGVYQGSSGAGERGFTFGLDNLTLPVGSFGILAANSTTEWNSTDSGQSGAFASPDTWYRITATWMDGVSGGKDVTLTAFDLTNDTDHGIVVSAHLTDSEFGPDPTTFEGINYRTTRGLLDNVQGTFLASTDDADFDEDGDIDGADFLTWQRNFGIDDGSAILADGDATGDGNVNADDLGVWQTQYGPTPPVNTVAIPEPTCLTLICASLLAFSIRPSKSAEYL